jgi:hypothetical protein
MKISVCLAGFLLSLQLSAQDTTNNNLSKDSTINNLLKDVDTPNEKKEPVKIFNSEKAINANTTTMVGKGKMDFRVTHNFDDIDGKGGVFGRFLGLDNARDVRIGFHIGLSNRFDLIVARDKGASTNVNRIYELGFKWLLAQQLENDPKHPLSLALFANTATATSKASSLPNFEGSFGSLSDRMSQVIQLIIARKFNKISLELNPTFVHTNYVIMHDDNSMFAIGGAIRFPVSRSFNIILDYFHSFRSKSSKDFFKTVDVSYTAPSYTYNPVPLTFYDPIGISFEILTAGHVFNLNFTNATEILENRFIPRTTSSWTKGKFRWGFTISRKFVLWRS